MTLPEAFPSSGLSSKADRSSKKARENPWEVIVFLAAGLLGAALAALLMPSLVRHAPTDIARIPHLLEAALEGTEDPSIIVLGNSVAMCGVDTRRLSSALPSSPLSFNFASTGQTIIESKLFSDALPESVETVVLFLTHRELVSKNDLDASKFNAFYMGGFRISPESQASIERGYPHLAPLLAEGEWQQRFRARWVIPGFVDGGFRRLLQKDLALERAKLDLYFPQPYTKQISEAKLESALGRFLSRARELGDEIPAAREQLLRDTIGDLADSGRRVLLVTPPVHPRIAANLGRTLPATSAALFSSLSEHERVEWLDATSELEESGFIDDVHPTTEGAEFLTDQIAQVIRTR